MGSIIRTLQDLETYGAAVGGSGGISWGAAEANAQSWSDVQRLLGLTTVPQSITVDPFATIAYTITPGGVDLHGSWLQIDTPAVANAEVHLVDGAQIRNLGGGAQGGVRNGVMLVYEGTGATPPLVWDSMPGNPVGFLSLVAGGSLRNDGTAPMITVPPGAFFILGSILNGNIQPGANSQPVVALETGAVMILAYLESPSNDTSTNFDPLWVTGDGTNFIGIMHDDGFDFSVITTWTGFTGLVLNLPLGFNGGSGPTAFRPVSMSGSLPSGMTYYDTTLGFPIWWSQFSGFWVNAAGAGPQ
jgi:hypothetical protein